jgi:hypothetical protein
LLTTTSAISDDSASLNNNVPQADAKGHHGQDSTLSAPGIRQRTNDILLLHVEVNSIADYYDVPNLKEMANERIKRLLDHQWIADGFCNVLNQAMSTSTDENLHTILAAVTSAHVEDVIGQDSFSDLELTGKFTTMVLLNVISAQSAKYKALEESNAKSRKSLQTWTCAWFRRYAISCQDKLRISNLERDLAKDRKDLKGYKESLKKSLEEHRKSLKDHEEKLEDLDHFISYHRDVDGCSHCGREFNSFIDEYDYEGKIRLVPRCGDCYTKHFDK